MVVTPRPAATVVLIRPAGRGFEVLLVRRHGRIAFMGGAHVFPGGRVDPADRIDRPESICDGVAQAVAGMRDLEPVDAVAHYVAATRELLEEAGVLLATAIAPARVPDLRRDLHEGTHTLPELIRREGVRLSLDLLVPFARWVTPEVEPKRFDTWFFAAAMPAGQDALHDDRETIESEWLQPGDAIERCRRGDIALPPPTWTTLRMLSTMSTGGDVLRWARQRRIVAVQPGFVNSEHGPMLTLPGDPLFPATGGDDVPSETRFILVEGRWQAVT